MTVAHIIGARPQFVKAAVVSRALRKAGITELLIHTGQHYDAMMSEVFFEELGLPEPDEHLGIGPAPLNVQLAGMLSALEESFARSTPDIVLVHGDTTTTLAGALAASNRGIPLAHNEAGLRSNNRAMPEERNRIIADHCADLLFCPTESSVRRLHREGLTQGIHFTGDAMYDAALLFGGADSDTEVPPAPYALATVHRNYTADVPDRLKRLMELFGALPYSVVFPVHPRTAAKISEYDIEPPANVQLRDPVGYRDMLRLERHAALILTDSGGVQKEAYFFGVPCITLRPETEWIETVESGWNVAADLDHTAVDAAIRAFDRSRPRPDVFGDGGASERIAQILLNFLEG